MALYYYTIICFNVVVASHRFKKNTILYSKFNHIFMFKLSTNGNIKRGFWPQYSTVTELFIYYYCSLYP